MKLCAGRGAEFSCALGIKTTAAAAARIRTVRWPPCAGRNRCREQREAAQDEIFFAERAVVVREGKRSTTLLGDCGTMGTPGGSVQYVFK